MKITIISENSIFNPELEAEFGLSILLEQGDAEVLFDCGNRDTCINNARKLGIDLSTLTAIAFSHNHRDHCGGFIRIAKEIKPIWRIHRCYRFFRDYCEGERRTLLTVGELSKRFGLNVQTLHYYDLIDVFKPNYRNDITGKRGYDLNQVYKLATIRYLRKMGCSIDEIKRYVKNPSPVFIDNLLDKKVKEIKRQMDEIVLIQKAIDRKNSFIESQKDFMDSEQPFIRYFDNRLCLPIGSEDVIYFEDIFYFFPTVVVYDKNGKHFGAYLYDSGTAGFHNSFVRTQNTISIPGGDFLVGYHKGSYETIYDKMLQIRNSRPDLKLDDEMIDFNIIDQFKEVDSDNFVTEINIRILAYEK